MRGRNNGGGGNNNNNNNNNNNRRGPNPLTRNYESNGPDVKIRGSAQQIAEKYATLARDAHSSGDRVMAENYLQHAEHYNRIIAAAQAQFAPQQTQTLRDDLDDDADDGSYGYEGGMNGGEALSPVNQAPAQPIQPVNGSGPQPIIDGLPAEVALSNENQGQPHSGGGRHRDRRHQHHRNPMNSGNAALAPNQPEPADPVVVQVVAEEAVQPISAPPAAEQPAVEAQTAEPQQAPRRGRRPRRPIAVEDAGQQPQGDTEGGPAENAVVPAES